MDVIACFKTGYRGALAPLGTALTEEQIFVLWKMIPSDNKMPILCFDGDNAGRRAAVRAAERLLPHLKANHSARFAFLPEGQDPDTLLKSGGKKAFDTVLKSALPLVDFLWITHTQGKTFPTPEARAGLSQSIENDVLRIQDRDVQYHYRQILRGKLRDAFGGFGSFKGAKKSFRRGKDNNNAVEAVTQLRRPSFSKARSIKLSLLACVINHPQIFDHVEERLGMLDMGDVRLNIFRQAVLEFLLENHGSSREQVISAMRDAQFDDGLRAVLNESVYTHAGFAKPEADEADLLNGWDRAWEALSQMEADQEKKTRNV